MMNTIALDTLEYATKLKAGGFTDQQAEASARALAEALDQQIVTKTAASEHETSVKHELELVRIELKRDIRESELKLEARLAETKAELTRWVIGVGLLQTTIISAVLMKVAKLI